MGEARRGFHSEMLCASREDNKDGLKVVIVGDGAIGKTCQLRKIMHSKGELKRDGVPIEFDINEAYEATTFDTQSLQGLEYKGKKYNVELWDTAGQEAMESLRRLSYPDADVFLLGFAVNSQISLDNVLTKW